MGSTGALVGVSGNCWVAIGGHRGESNSVGVGIARRAGSARALGDLKCMLVSCDVAKPEEDDNGTYSVG